MNNAGGTLGWRAAECMPISAQREHSSNASNGNASSSSSDLLLSLDATTLMTKEPPSDSSSGMPPLTTELTIGRITKSIDIFSAGCVFYYVLSNGEHPFGDRYSREVNILKGQYNLDALDGLGEEGVIAKYLLERMIQRDYLKWYTPCRLETFIG